MSVVTVFVKILSRLGTYFIIKKHISFVQAHSLNIPHYKVGMDFTIESKEAEKLYETVFPMNKRIDITIFVNTKEEEVG